MGYRPVPGILLTDGTVRNRPGLHSPGQTAGWKPPPGPSTHPAAGLAGSAQRASPDGPPRWACPYRVTAYRTSGAMMSANAVRARLRRDLTVPRFTPVMSAISS